MNIYSGAFNIIGEYYSDVGELSKLSSLIERYSIIHNFVIKNPSVGIKIVFAKTNEDNNSYFVFKDSTATDITSIIHSIFDVDNNTIIDVVNKDENGVPKSDNHLQENKIYIGIYDKVYPTFLKYADNKLDYMIFDRYNLKRLCYFYNLQRGADISPVAGEIIDIDIEAKTITIDDNVVSIKEDNIEHICVNKGDNVKKSDLLTKLIECNQVDIISFSDKLPKNVFYPFFLFETKINNKE